MHCDPDFRRDELRNHGRGPLAHYCYCYNNNYYYYYYYYYYYGMISTRNTIISTSKRLHGLHAIAHEMHVFSGVFSRQVVLQQARSIAQHLQQLSCQ